MKPCLLPILLATLALSTGLHAFAAEETGEAPAQIAMEELAARLNLTPDQQAQIAPALEERNNRLKAMKGDLDASASRRQKFKALKEARSIQQEFVSKMSPVLTKDQQAEWDKLRGEAREQFKERRKH